MGTKWGTPAAVRFFAKVEKTSTCWLWTAATTKGGYGIFGGEDTYKTTTAHRWSYEQHVGPIPEGLQVDHLCRVRALCQPRPPRARNPEREPAPRPPRQGRTVPGACRMTPAEAGAALAALTPPITDAQALEAARILASAS